MNTPALPNKFNLTSAADLHKAEERFCSIRGKGIMHRHGRGEYGEMSLADRLQAVHKEFFSDLYSWAGDFRDVNMVRRAGVDETVLKQFFANTLDSRPGRVSSEGIQAGVRVEIDSIEDWLSSQNPADPKTTAELVRRLNEVCPFRDGNGRVIREVVRQLTAENGLAFEFMPSLRERWNDCSRAASHGKVGLLTVMISEMLHPLPAAVATPAKTDGAPKSTTSAIPRPA